MYVMPRRHVTEDDLKEIVTSGLAAGQQKLFIVKLGLMPLFVLLLFHHKFY